jgi:hypothetical protein
MYIKFKNIFHAFMFQFLFYSVIINITISCTMFRYYRNVSVLYPPTEVDELPKI